MKKNHFLLLKKFKDTSSAQLWATAAAEVMQEEPRLTYLSGTWLIYLFPLRRLINGGHNPRMD